MSNLQLAITKIGDLLLNDKITKGQDGKAIENITLAIPDYQRPYKWTARNVIQLLDDIIEAKNNNKEVYRVGTLILHENNGKYDIVDGQQRTITFSLLLYVLMEALHLDNDDTSIKFLQQDIFNNEHNRHNIPNNYNALRRRLNRKKSDNDDTDRELKQLYGFVTAQCELIVVITDDVSEAFQFFDSQNARGKALYPHDLLKAYHLREMRDVSNEQTEAIVKQWEKIPQYKLAELFGDYIYRVKEWINGEWAGRLSEHNIYKFKGVTRKDNTPYAQFYKSAYAYAAMINNSAMPFVSGTRDVNAFQLNAPIIAGKPFFDYTNHYYEILQDVRDNSKYEGFYVKGNEIVDVLDHHFNYGVGNRITRLLFDSAMLLYVDRFCPATFPTPAETELFEQFLVQAFIWAYSLRAQYKNLGWQSAQNYVLSNSDRVNSFNIYKLIADADSPVALISLLTDRLVPIGNVTHKRAQGDVNDKNNYIYFFNQNKYYQP